MTDDNGGQCDGASQSPLTDHRPGEQTVSRFARVDLSNKWPTATRHDLKKKKVIYIYKIK